MNADEREFDDVEPREHAWIRPTFSSAVLAVLACALVAGSGCVSPSEEGSGGTDWTVRDTGSDAQSDVGVDGGDGSTEDTGTDTDDAGERQPYETNFTLENDTGRPLHFRRLGPCSGGDAWISVRDGRGELALESDCTTCSCEDARSGGCGVCAIACPRKPTKFPSIEPGDSKTYSWDGVGFRSEEIGGRACHEHSIPPKGREMTATFCTVPGPTADGERRCKNVTFRYGEDTDVSASFGEHRQPVETTFELTNNTGADVSIKPVGPCSATNPWVSLQEGSTPVDLKRSCASCTCDELRSGEGCSVCKLRCPEPATPSLEDGETKRLTWKGIGYRRGRIDGRSCQERWIPERGEKVKARFCIRRNAHLAHAPPADCKTVTFRYGEETTVSEVFEPNRPAIEHTIRIENAGQTDIHVQRYSEYCTQNPPGWASLLRSGSEVEVSAQCDCTCSDLRETGSCRVCAARGAPCRPQEMRTPLEPGDEMTWEWSGRMYEPSSYDGRSCLRKTIPKAGSSFQVRFCWDEKTAVDGLREECATKRLTYGQSNAVVHEVNRPVR